MRHSRTYSHFWQISSFLIAFVVLSFSTHSLAQKGKVIAKLTPTKILIGEQTTLDVRVVHPKGQKVELLLPKDTLVAGVEVIKTVLSDSTDITDKLQEYLYKVTLTAFDSATYQLQNIRAMVGGVLLELTDPPLLMVTTLPVDLKQPEKYNPIKGQWEPDFVWMDYIWVLYLIGGLLLIALLVYFWIRWRKKRNAPITPSEPLAVVDPYTEAIQSMETLKGEQLWEHNRIKEYYTGITDILRRFIWRVYGIETSEKTTSEILESFRKRVNDKELDRILKRVLSTADMAKFAKYTPASDENMSVMTASIAFIEEQKKTATVEEESNHLTGEEEVTR